MDESARSEQHGDDAVATALRERARAVRMNESLDQASRERDEAKSRALELEQRYKEAAAEAERLRGELAQRGYGGPGQTNGQSSGPGGGVAESDPASPNAQNG
jgi:hypothetical protein